MLKVLYLTSCVLLLALTGCQRVNEERTLSVELNDVKAVTIEAPKREQRLAVTATAAVPIDVYVVLEKDRSAVEEALQKGARPDKLLASQLKVEQASLEATVPAQNEYSVLVRSTSGKKADVKLKITGK
jgi:hypothetical protein